MSSLQQIKKECIRVGYDGGKLVVEVLTLSWNGPHSPVEKWVVAEAIPCCVTPMSNGYEVEPIIVPPGENSLPVGGVLGASVLDIEEVINQVWKSDQYFGYCKHCDGYFMVGYMFMEKQCCDGCAHEHLGIVF